jgi:FkbM family methyltransferase
MNYSAIVARIVGFVKVFWRLGFSNACRFKRVQLEVRRGTSADRVSSLASRHAFFPVKCRNGTSDWRVFHQVFVELQYGVVPLSLRPTLIVDAGANVGLSACYLLSRFPEARLIGVEPDDGNLQLAVENLQPYGDRAVLVMGAVWSEPARLDLHQPGDVETDHWAIQAQEARGGGPGEAQGYSLEQILAMAEAEEEDRILLKMDIEGAERNIFSGVSDALIERFAAIAIELHGEEAAEVFFSRVGKAFSVSGRGETTYAERLKG